MVTQIKKSKVVNTNGRGKENYERFLLTIPKCIGDKYMGKDLVFINTASGFFVEIADLKIGAICKIDSTSVHQETQTSLNGLHGTVIKISKSEAIVKVDIKGKYYKLPFALEELKPHIK